jgi:hypothetical protein
LDGALVTFDTKPLVNFVPFEEKLPLPIQIEQIIGSK